MQTQSKASHIKSKFQIVPNSVKCKMSFERGSLITEFAFLATIIFSMMTLVNYLDSTLMDKGNLKSSSQLVQLKDPYFEKIQSTSKFEIGGIGSSPFLTISYSDKSGLSYVNAFGIDIVGTKG